eukprot:scaffold98238_cov17-Tisochrysis_lutea.AAC.2
MRKASQAIYSSSSAVCLCVKGGTEGRAPLYRFQRGAGCCWTGPGSPLFGLEHRLDNLSCQFNFPAWAHSGSYYPTQTAWAQIHDF